MTETDGMQQTILTLKKSLIEKSEAYARATDDYLDLENRRVHEKIAAIKRIMEKPNDMTGKAHSFSSAEAIVNTDDTYMNYLDRIRRAQVDQLLARGQYETERLTSAALLTELSTRVRLTEELLQTE